MIKAPPVFDIRQITVRPVEEPAPSAPPTARDVILVGYDPDKPDPRMARLRSGGTVFIHSCCVCGQTNAPFGYDANVRAGRLGTWYCAAHRPTKGVK